MSNMKDWQIAVMVVIVFVFVAGCITLGIFIYRVWLSGKNIENSTSSHHKRTNMYVYNDANSIRTGRDLQQAIAMQADLANPDTLTLTYVNTSHVFVEMDLDLLVREDDQLGRRLRHTGERPLYLGRVSSCPPALMGSNNDPNYNPNSGYNRNQNIEVNVNHPGETVGNGANVLYSPPADRVLYSPADDVMESSGQGPVPCIFPVRSHVVVDTPIVVSAATYYFTNNNNNSNNILQDRATVTALEAVMSGCERSTTVYPGAGPFAGSRLEVLPTQGVVTLNGQCVLRRVPAAHVRVTVDRHDASQWERYKGPFYLTPGRWCVRARASNHDDREVSSIARVFTVDVV